MVTGPLISTDIRFEPDWPDLTTPRQPVIIRSLPEAVYSSTLAGTITSWNQGAEQLFGRESGNAVGLHIARLVPSGSRMKLTRALAGVAAREQVDIPEMVFQDSDGHAVEASVRAVPVLDEAGRVVEAIWHCRDLRELRRLERIIWEEKERTETAFGLMTEGVIMTDASGCITYMNPAAEQITGQVLAAVHGQPASRTIHLVHEESREPVESPVEVCLREGRGLDRSRHNVIVRGNNEVMPVDDTVAPLVNREGELIGAALVLCPSSRGSSAAGADSYLAAHDADTGAVAPRELEHRLEQALIQTARENTRHALLYLRLARYAEISSNHGAAAGRELMKQISVMLRTQIRDLDTLARIQDDEFAILLHHCPLLRARRIARQLRETVSAFPFYWEDQAYNLDLCIGVTPISSDTGKAARILDAARTACHAADAENADAIRVLDAVETGRSSSVDWSAPGTAISRALAQGRFRLYQQRIAPLANERNGGDQCEMFLYMVDETGKMMRPSVFISAAKRAGRMGELDRWVVHSVFRMLGQAWRPEIAIWTINISTETLLDETFPAYVRSQFAEFGVPPQWICFEIEEPAAIEHIGAATRFIRDLRPLGFAFCLSHFGAGLNSYSYLRNLPVDFLKLDASLVRNVLDDPVDRAIVGSVNRVAHVMGMATIAAQVEDEEQFESLRQLEVDYVQGYAVAEPEPLSIVS